MIMHGKNRKILDAKKADVPFLVAPHPASANKNATSAIS